MCELSVKDYFIQDFFFSFTTNQKVVRINDHFKFNIIMLFNVYIFSCDLNSARIRNRMCACNALFINICVLISNSETALFNCQHDIFSTSRIDINFTTFNIFMWL